MSFLGSSLVIVTGLAMMGAGLFLFYAWLPLLYAIVGFDIGALLGQWMTGDMGILAITMGIIGAVVLGLASYYLEPFRRILMGISAGVLMGLTLANLFGFDGRMGAAFGTVLAILFGVVGASVVPRYFDLFVVVTHGRKRSNLGNVRCAFHHAGRCDLRHGNRRAGSPDLLSLALAAVGIVWQFSNIEKWLKAYAGPVRRVV